MSHHWGYASHNGERAGAPGSIPRGSPLGFPGRVPAAPPAPAAATARLSLRRCSSPLGSAGSAERGAVRGMPCRGAGRCCGRHGDRIASGTRGSRLGALWRWRDRPQPDLPR